MEEDVKIEVPNEEVKEAELTKEETASKNEWKGILALIIIIVTVFAISLGSFKYLYKEDQITGGITSVDELHKRNINGELSREYGYVYNGFSFVKYDGLWWTEVEKQGRLIKIPLHFSPKDVDFIEVEGELGADFNDGEEVFISISPTTANKFYTLSAAELSSNVVKGINRMPVAACTEDNEICTDRLILNCENTEGKPVVELSLEEEPGIELSGTCIKIKGKDYNLVRAVDRLLLKWYGVME